MVFEHNRRAPKVPGKKGEMVDDGAPPPTEREVEEWKQRLRDMNMPDVRI